MGRTKLQLTAQRRHRNGLRSISDELRRLREDSGLSQTIVARAAGISQGYISEIEAGLREPTLETLHLLAAVLGCDLSVRLFPNSGPAISDRFQAGMVEALLRILHPRWIPFLEVPVQRPVRGIIDLVLVDRAANLLVATEVQSDLKRVEQQLRWAHQKADALAATELAARTRATDLAAPARATELAARTRATDLAAPARATELAARTRAEASRDPAISRLLVLRSTQRTRNLAHELPITLGAEFPAEPKEALEALMTADAAWPGAALLWATVDGSTATIQRRGRTRWTTSARDASAGDDVAARRVACVRRPAHAAAARSSGNLTAHPAARPEIAP